MKTLFAILALAFTLPTQAAITTAAALQSTNVVDVETLDDSLLGTTRPDGLVRVECPDYVQKGWFRDASNTNIWYDTTTNVPLPAVTRRYLLPSELLWRGPAPVYTNLLNAAQTNSAVLLQVLKVFCVPFIASDDTNTVNIIIGWRTSGYITAAQLRVLNLMWRRTPPIIVTNAP
jgi:hypothetical protein